MARERKLKEILNLRLDVPLAKEIRRLAQAQGRSESEVARTLLGYGAEVSGALRRSSLWATTRAKRMSARVASRSRRSSCRIRAKRLKKFARKLRAAALQPGMICSREASDRAIDFFQGEQARKGRAGRTRDDYFRKLVLLCPKEGDCPPVRDVSSNDCRRVLDRWRDSAPGTRYHSWAVLSSFFGWLYRAGVIDVNPMARIEPPSRHHPEDLPVTTVSAHDVRRLFDACETWHELLCLSTLAYLGPRRRAASGLRRRDLDLDRGTIPREGRNDHRPLPEEFAELLRYASAAGVIGTEPDAYVIPMIRDPATQRRARRQDHLADNQVSRRSRRRGGHPPLSPGRVCCPVLGDAPR